LASHRREASPSPNGGASLNPRKCHRRTVAGNEKAAHRTGVTMWRHVLAIYLLIAFAAEAVLVRLNVASMRSSDGRSGRWDATDIAGTIVLAMLWPISLLLLLT
jgi:hypothetical protein